MSAQVSVQFSASIKDLIEATDRVKKEIEGIKESAATAVEGLKGLGAAFGVAFSIERIVEFVGEMAKAGEETERMAAMLGASTSGVQELGAIAKLTGGSADSMALSMERLQVNLQKAATGTGPAAAALHALGLNARELIGLPIEQQLDKIADAVSRFADGGNKTAIVMELLGRGGAQMIPFLDQGAAGMERLRQETLAVGGVMSTQTVGVLANMQHNLVLAQEAASGLGATLVSTFARGINDATHGVTEFLSGMNALIQSGKLWDAALEEIRGFAAQLAAELMLLGTIAKDVFTLDWGSVSADWDKGLQRAQEVVAEHARNMADIMGSARAEMVKIESAGESGSGKPQAPATDLGAGKGATSAFQEQIKLADEAFRAVQQHLDSEVKLHQITASQETQILLAELDKRKAAEDAVLAKEQSLGNLSIAEQQRVANQKLAIDQKYAQDRQRILDKGAQDEQKAWESITGPILSAWNSQLKGLLAGTETFGEAMKNIFADMVIKIIEYLEKVVVEEVVVKALMTAIGFPSLPGFAAGAWEIPAAGAAILHPGEMVVPAGPAEALRQSLSGGGPGASGGGSSQNVTFNVSAIDAAGVQSFFQRNASQITRVLQGHMSQNPSYA